MRGEGVEEIKVFSVFSSERTQDIFLKDFISLFDRERKKRRIGRGKCRQREREK